jgi:hypothetical protein
MNLFLNEVLQIIIDAFNWCWVGFYGTLRAMAFAHVDVPPLQCILGTAAFVVPIILIDIFIFDRIKKSRRNKNL